ncbi:hypothetical protein ACXYMX_03880 [Sporosarcina sp. CAU 1771]
MTDQIKEVVNQAYELVGIANENTVPELETIRACVSLAMNGRNVPTSKQVQAVLKEAKLFYRDGEDIENSPLKEVW